MGDYERPYPRLSLCGLNCGLCPRFHTDGPSRCPGCGGKDFGAKRPACGVISCSKKHDQVEYCYACGEYPCKKYDGVDRVDSFVSHRNMFKDFARAKTNGIDAYRAELDEKVDILQTLLNHYNDGRRKSFFCTAVNLLDLCNIRDVMATLAAELPADTAPKEKAAFAVQLLQQTADKNGIDLKLNNKSSKRES